jgi:hypothetical protein
MAATLTERRSENPRVEFSRDLLQNLEDHQEMQFDGMTTGDESSFQQLIRCDCMRASSREAVIPKTRPGISTTPAMLTVLFTSRKLFVLDAVPMGQNDSQN